jgi:hypothetical protein
MVRGGDGQVGGDVLMGAASVSQSNDLEPIMERAVGRLRLGERLFEALGLGVRKLDANHGRGKSEEPVGVSLPSGGYQGAPSLLGKGPNEP